MPGTLLTQWVIEDNGHHHPCKGAEACGGSYQRLGVDVWRGIAVLLVVAVADPAVAANPSATVSRRRPGQMGFVPGGGLIL